MIAKETGLQSDAKLRHGHKVFLNRVDKVGDNSLEHSFKSLADIQSGPKALFGFNWRMSFSTPVGSTMMSGISGYGVPYGVGTWLFQLSILLMKAMRM